MAGKSLFIFVGDLSADKYTAHIIRKLQESEPDLKVWGVGGPMMRETGMEMLANCEDLAVIGPIETLLMARVLYGVQDRALAEIIARKPDLVMLVDFGGNNIRLSRRIRKAGLTLPIYYFISPQVWASRPYRMRQLARTITKMLVIFPFEEKLYIKNGLNTKFVGHPLTRIIPQLSELPSREEFCQKHGLDPLKPIITVFSGSRNNEINTLAPMILQAINWVLTDRPECQFVISQANERIGESINRCIKRAKLTERIGKNIVIVQASENNAAVKAADLVWAKSGTTTLEVALLGRPMLVFYKGMWISYALFRAYVRIKRVAWPNLLAGGELVPELIQLDCRAEQLVKYTCDFLDVPALREKISQRLAELREQLGHGDYVQNVSSELLEALDANPTKAELA